MNEKECGEESEDENRAENQYADDGQHEDEYEGKSDDEYEGSAEGDGQIAKIYYADEEATQVDAAFVIEDWDWVVGFNQVATDEYDYVSIPIGKVIGVMSPKYTTFSRNGRRVTGYGIDDEEADTFADQLPI